MLVELATVVGKASLLLDDALLALGIGDAVALDGLALAQFVLPVRGVPALVEGLLLCVAALVRRARLGVAQLILAARLRITTGIGLPLRLLLLGAMARILALVDRLLLRVLTALCFLSLRITARFRGALRSVTLRIRLLALTRGVGVVAHGLGAFALLFLRAQLRLLLFGALLRRAFLACTLLRGTLLRGACLGFASRLLGVALPGLLLCLLLARGILALVACVAPMRSLLVLRRILGRRACDGR